jgi:hypothetical protein
MSDPLRVQLSGPLSVHATGFREELLRRGYRPGTAAKLLQLMAHLSRWMAAQDLEPADLRTAEVERFVQERRATAASSWRRPARWSRCWGTCADSGSCRWRARARRRPWPARCLTATRSICWPSAG